ncbi:reverse transcriptase domain-containing protein [Streptomyces sp. NBC_01320]|nr:reverse transcriptase domain-containing protein [Streptomyces sp. NBC_01320]
MGRGPGPRQVLRPSESRCAYGAGGSPGEGQKGPEVDSAVPGSRDYERRRDGEERGRDPAGFPLSPLLSNIMLDDLDRELFKRGHRFVRYADDVMIFVRSERAAQRTLASVTAFIEKTLKLRVNREKSKACPIWWTSLLGFGYYLAKGGSPAA